MNGNRESIAKIAKAIAENPNAEVLFLLPTEIGCDECYYAGVVSEIDVDFVWNDSGFLRKGEDDIKDRIMFDSDCTDDSLIKSIADAEFESMLSSGVIKKQILVTMRDI